MYVDTTGVYVCFYLCSLHRLWKTCYRKEGKRYFKGKGVGLLRRMIGREGEKKNVEVSTAGEENRIGTVAITLYIP